MICFSTFSLSKTKGGWLDVHFTLALIKNKNNKKKLPQILLLFSKVK